MKAVKRYLPADFDTPQLQEAAGALAELLPDLSRQCWPLAAMLSDLHFQIVQEQFLRLGHNPGDREKLQQLWQEMHGH